MDIEIFPSRSPDVWVLNLIIHLLFSAPFKPLKNRLWMILAWEPQFKNKILDFFFTVIFFVGCHDWDIYYINFTKCWTNILYTKFPKIQHRIVKFINEMLYAKEIQRTICNADVLGAVLCWASLICEEGNNVIFSSPISTQHQQWQAKWFPKASFMHLSSLIEEN